jgi:hypothetical protein
MTNILLVMLVKRALLITASFHSPLVNERQSVSEHLLPIPCTYKTAEWKKMKITRTYILPLAGDVGEESLVNHGVVSLLFQLQPKLVCASPWGLARSRRPSESEPAD